MSKRNRFRHDNRVRLIFTLGLAVLLPAAALIYVNFRHLESIKRDKKVEALIHRDFQYVLAVSEKKLNQKAYAMTEEVRDLFPSPDSDSESDKLKKLDLLLSKTPWLAHVFLFDHDKGMLFRSQPQQLNDTYCRKEHEILAESYSGWFGMEGKMLVEGLHKKSRPFSWYTSQTKRADGDAYITTAFFVLPQVSRDRVVLGGAHTARSPQPEAIVSGVNRDLCRIASVAPLASLFLARLDPVTGMLDYCSAGHPPALLLRADGQLESLSEGGPLLGVVPAATFDQGSVQLRAGEVLLICSDGILESFNEADQEFGRERLEAELRSAGSGSADAVLFSVLGAVQDFASPRALTDDMTLVVVNHNRNTTSERKIS